MYDLVGLQGLVAHLRGEWFQRLAVELRRGRSPAGFGRGRSSTRTVRRGVPALRADAVSGGARNRQPQLRETARAPGVLRAVAFATALRGEAALLTGDLGRRSELGKPRTCTRTSVDRRRGPQPAAAGGGPARAGERAEANRLLNRALPLARFSGIALHIIQRVYGTMIEAATDAEAARAVVDRAAATLCT